MINEIGLLAETHSMNQVPFNRVLNQVAHPSFLAPKFVRVDKDTANSSEENGHQQTDA